MHLVKSRTCTPRHLLKSGALSLPSPRLTSWPSTRMLPLHYLQIIAADEASSSPACACPAQFQDPLSEHVLVCTNVRRFSLTEVWIESFL